MSNKFFRFFSSLLVICLAFTLVSPSFAVPPRPDLLEKWQKVVELLEKVLEISPRHEQAQKYIQQARLRLKIE